MRPNPLILRKSIIVKKHRKLFILVVASLLTLPACEQQPSANKTDGIKDAMDVRPNEEMRDLGEDVGKAAKDIGRDLKDAVQEK
jgi:hypothetical protein